MLPKEYRRKRAGPCYHERMEKQTHNARRGRPAGSPAEEYGELQHLVDALYEHDERVSRLDVIVRAETDDLGEDLLEIVYLLPAGTYKRGRLCDQLNSIVTAHGWGLVYGTVE